MALNYIRLMFLMSEFKEIPASKLSLSKRKLVYGVGLNDANYAVTTKINSITLRCPIYVKWFNMLTRCYSDKFKEKRTSYADCSVASDWLVFSSFKLWMEKQDWAGKELDKDLLIQGNKKYSQETCLFIDRSINVLFISSSATRGKYMLGVSFHKREGKFRSTCSDGNGGSVYLGDFTSEELAHNAYKKYKYNLIKELASKQDEPVKSAMLNYIINEY